MILQEKRIYLIFLYKHSSAFSTSFDLLFATSFVHDTWQVDYDLVLKCSAKSGEV